MATRFQSNMYKFPSKPTREKRKTYRSKCQRSSRVYISKASLLEAEDSLVPVTGSHEGGGKKRRRKGRERERGLEEKRK